MKIFLTVLIIIVIVLLLRYKKKCKREKYKVIKDVNDPILEENKNIMKLIYPQLDKLNIKPMYDCIPEDSNTYDKKKIEVCVKKKDGKYLNNNKIRHILLHELAHYTSPKTDKEHKTKEFIDSYNKLMKESIQMGILDVNKLK